VHASTGNVTLSAADIWAHVRTRGGIETDRVSLVTNLYTPSAIFSFRSGEEVLHGDVYTFARGADYENRLAGRCRFAFVSLTAERLSNQCGEDVLRGDIGFWERHSWFRPPAAIRVATAQAMRRIIQQVPQSGCLVARQALRQLEFDLIEPFLWSVVFDERRSHERDSRPAALIVRKVEDWLDGQSPEKVQLVDVCRAVHVSRRTLHRAFKETLGMGPTRYFMLKRLTAVRSELQRSDPAAVTVTAIAGKYGFWELGRFARDYQRVFRERPSETLRRSAATSPSV
jgi:AraC family ethanolamine operon transcriptional activator